MHEQLAPELDAAMEQRFSSRRLISLAESVVDRMLQGFQHSRDAVVGDPRQTGFALEPSASTTGGDSPVSTVLRASQGDAAHNIESDVEPNVIENDALDWQLGPEMPSPGHFDFDQSWFDDFEVDLSSAAGPGYSIPANDTAVPQSELLAMCSVQTQPMGLRESDSSETGGIDLGRHNTQNRRLRPVD